jgi:RHS repeat-associated protein
MIQKLLYKFIGLSVALLCFFQQAGAQFQEGVELIPIVSHTPGTAILANATNILPNTTTGPSKILNIITLKINEEGTTFFASNFSVSVKFNLELTDFNDVVRTENNLVLTVNYDNTQGAKYKVLDYKTYRDYKKVKITFDATAPITITPASAGWNPKLVIEVNNEMRTTVFNNLSSSALDLFPTFTTTGQPTPDVLQLGWTFPAAAHENMTQLEWAYIEDEMFAFYNGDYNLIFQSNSTRVDLEYSSTGYSYKIPLLYPGPGKVYYRARAVQRKANGTLITGNWSTISASVGNQGNYPFAGHETNLNWQSSTSFAEGGKSKTVIQYFDGSLRGRQTVTKDNSTGNTIVGETIYDLQGRPNLQILPTPTTGTSIQYFKNFNRFSNQQLVGAPGSQYYDDPAKYFDLTPVGVNKCDGADSLKSIAGNGRYYSASNDWLNGTNGVQVEAKSKFIPDAQGYAYTETRFTDDATQRVTSQGGVGKDHQIGSGHETKYYYGKPSQHELDALFGTEVGDASHYSKNMVRDANGQISVSYTDMHGRTIATALAGDPTSGIDSIINAADYPLASGVIRNDLLTPATNIIRDNTIESISTILVSKPSTYNFTYKLTPPILQLLSCTNQPVCFDCKYNLEISIRNEDCGDVPATILKYNNLQIVPANQACGTPMGFVGEGITSPASQINFGVPLLTGSYVIRKTLTINDSMFQVRRDSALKVLLCKTRDSIFNKIYDSLSITSGCGATPAQACDSCRARLGTFTIYRSKYLIGIGVDPGTITPELDITIHRQYSTDSSACENVCGALNEELTTLKSLRRQMLEDMMPYNGQYALPLDSMNVSGTAGPDYTRLEAKYNIFSEQYTGTIRPPYFHFPVTEAPVTHFYYTANNKVDSSVHGHNINGGVLLDTMTPPVFTSLFQPSWANSLITYHPEYNKLKYAEANLKTSYDWLDKVQSADLYLTAHSSGYDNPLSATVNADPFFAIPENAVDKGIMNQRITEGINVVNGVATGQSIWQIANSIVWCATADNAAKESCANQMVQQQSLSKTQMHPSILEDTLKTKVWQQFRSMYLSYRNELVLKYIDAHAGTTGNPVLTAAEREKLIKVEGKKMVFATNQELAYENGIGTIYSNANTTGDTTGMAAYIAANSLDNCEGQRPFWKARLKQCEVLKNRLKLETKSDSAFVNNVINRILDSLVMICRNSVAPLQPYGASTVNPAYVGNPRSFEAVINNVLRDSGIATLPGNNYYCNPFTITYPKPYGLNPAVFTNYSNTLDSCACNRFKILKTEATAAGKNPNSFAEMNQFLLEVYHDSLTLIVWNGLQQCSTSFTDTCCKKPVITAVVLTHSTASVQSGNYIKVTYQLPVNCDSCKLFMYNAAGTQVGVNNNICGTTNYSFTISDTCAKYKFIIKCQSSKCALLVGDTARYNGCTIPPNCTKPVITSIVPVSQGGVYTDYNVFYNLLPNCDTCKILMYDQANNLLQTNSNICGTTNSWFYEWGNCPVYKFVVQCRNSACGWVTSDPMYSNGCALSIAAAQQANAAADTCGSCILNVTSRAQYGQPNRYVAKCEINLLPNFESVVNDAFIAYIDAALLPCDTTNCLVFKPILLPGVAVIPQFLNCGYVKPCISCQKLTTLTDEFKLLYPAYNGVPFLDSTATDDQAKQNALWARFINFRVGFSKNAMDYMVAYKNCPSASSPANALCAFDKPLNDPSDIFQVDTMPCRNVLTQAQFIADLLFVKMKDSLTARFDSLYKAKCLSAQSLEEFYVTYQPKEYHYTLYYYDQAGNLVKTLPPAAVKPNYVGTYLATVATNRAAGTDYNNTSNNELLATQYRYNSLNQVVTQQTPDAGVSKFWYDKLGRLVVSQNAKQAIEGTYSYTLYDYQGRITQVGQKPQTAPMTQSISQNSVALDEWLRNSQYMVPVPATVTGGLRQQITRTVYDITYYNGEPSSALAPQLAQKNLRNRVSYTQIIDLEPTDYDNNPNAFAGLQAAATYYSYDIHGNVDTLLQDLKQAMANGNEPNRFKKMVYDYDLISGKVNRVAYQPGFTDQLYHKYGYDAENRITNVQTSHDSIYWENEAAYEYYRHGPMSRTVLGNNRVQGLDYAYTIQGWLKGVNASSVLPAFAPTGGGFDMGQDGLNSTTPASDAFGYSLNYFNGDYKPIGTNTSGFVTPFTAITNSLTAAADGVQLGTNLYNGNIRAMMVNIPQLGEAKLYGYRYDQLNRIKAMNSFNGFDVVTNQFGATNTPAVSEDYKERVTYDPNGNIKTYLRNGAQSPNGLAMDNLTYQYPRSGRLLNNRLRYVLDEATSSAYTEDLKSNAPLSITQRSQVLAENLAEQASDNYGYDAIGNLIKDTKEGINNIAWTVYGKIQSITKTNGTVINYTYDASGNRITKVVTTGGVTKTTFYVRDASGNVMGIYAKDATINSGALTQTEVSLYGSSRLGVWNINRNVGSIAAIDYSIYSGNFTRGNKLFELSNHLGNVLVTVSDKKLAVSANGNTIDYYTADVVTANDYYPFGMQMPGRKYSQPNSNYRYGFNGKENDNEVKGEGNQQDYGMRIYDTRLGRFLSVDPLTEDYPFYTPYQFAGNTPVQAIDLDGGEPDQVTEKVVKKTVLRAITKETVLAKVVPLTTRTVAVQLATKANLATMLWSLFSLQGCKYIPPHATAPNPVSSPAPTISPLHDLNPWKSPGDDDDNNQLYYIYSTRRSAKSAIGLVNEKSSGYIPGKGDLPYFGITKNAFIASAGINGRYGASSEEAEKLKYGAGILGKTDYNTAAGVELALIALNTYGKDFDKKVMAGKLRLSSVDVKKTTRIDNLKFSNKSVTMMQAGVTWLDANWEDWRNYFYHKQNTRGENHPDKKTNSEGSNKTGDFTY